MWRNEGTVVITALNFLQNLSPMSLSLEFATAQAPNFLTSSTALGLVSLVKAVTRNPIALPIYTPKWPKPPIPTMATSSPALQLLYKAPKSVAPAHRRGAQVSCQRLGKSSREKAHFAGA